MVQIALLVDAEHEGKSEEVITVWVGGLCCYCTVHVWPICNSNSKWLIIVVVVHLCDPSPVH